MSKIKANTIENTAGTVSVDVTQLNLTSPDGSKWKIVVDNNGNLTLVKQ